MQFLNMLNAVQASSINSANLYAKGDCGVLLKYKGVNVQVTYVKYNNGNISYPAYCLDKTLPGVTEEKPYEVSINNAINDLGLWKRIINGFPYKTIEELGCQSEEEAFTATKQAVYCYIHGNNPKDYDAVGESGRRTLNALNMIINNAQNSNETKISNTITINKLSSKWEEDKNNPKYISKIYSVSANSDITNYNVNLINENNILPDGIKITNYNNQEKTEFKPEEKFKISIPIKSLLKNGNFKINVQTTIKTKPVLYGKAPDSGYQDYAITVATYEDGNGKAIDTYEKNESKIIIKKQDENSKEELQDVEFELLDENKNIIQNNLKTDKEGKIKIENIIPGKYFIKETKTLDGYILNDKLIEVNIKLNQEITVLVNNKKEYKPSTALEVISKEVETKKLPVTGK